MAGKSPVSDSTLLLTNAESILHDDFVMARYRKLIAELNRQLAADSRSLNELNVEREKLRPAHNRFRELEDIAQPKQERVDIVAAMLLEGVQQTERTSKHLFWEPLDADESTNAVYIPTSQRAQRLSEYPLWRIIREIVRAAGEIQVVRLENALKDFGIKTRRQSIESALAVHKKDFKITRRGREKFVALK